MDMRPYDPRNAPEITFLREKCSASDIARSINANLVGRDIPIFGIATFGAKMRNSLSYQIAQPNSKISDETEERAVLCTELVAPSILASTKLVVGDPREAFIRFLLKAKLDWKKTVTLQADRNDVRPGYCEIAKAALVEEDTIIGRGTVIESHAVVKRGVIIGENSLISSGSILGAHGPATYRTRDYEILSHAKIHVGTLIIGNECEVGANSVILRAMLGRTFIGDKTILGNMVHIGHGCEIRERVWMAAGVTVCGHVFIDADVSVGAGATLRDNIDIGRNASIGMGSVVVKSVASKTSVLGVPAKERGTTLKSSPHL